MSHGFFYFDRALDDDEPPERPEPARPRGHQEYPKWVTPPGGEPMIVQNAEEEAQVMGRPAVPEPAVRLSGAVVPLATIVALPLPSQAAVAHDAISGRLVRAARGLLGRSQADLAHHAGLSIPTVQKIENAVDGEQRGSAESAAAIEQALSDAGLSWCDDTAECAVWMQKGQRDTSTR